MASAIQEIVTGFIAELADPANFTATNVVVGEGQRARNGPMPRIVFVPIGGPIEPPDRPGGRVIVTTGSGTKARQIYTRNLQILCELHGSNIENAEIMLHNSVRAMRKQLDNSVRFGEEVWLSQQEGEDGVNDFGEVVTFTFTVQLPIYDINRPLTLPSGGHNFVEGSELWDGEENPCRTPVPPPPEPDPEDP